MPYYFQKPDTAEDLEFKINNLNATLKVLVESLVKMKADLIKNHLTYDSTRIGQKQAMMKQTAAQIIRTNNKISNYGQKLKTLKK